jgi:hypothetical protein
MNGEIAKPSFRGAVGGAVRGVAGAAAIGLLALALAVPVTAHEHYAAAGQGGDGQLLANGQNHPRPFRLIDGKWWSCESDTIGAFGPAWYGLETAHHGPDSGDPGKGDRCYAADANPAVGGDVANDAIR